MQKITLLAIGGAVAVMAAVAVSLSGNLASPSNVTLDSPSGAQLVADDKTLLVDIRTPREWQQTGVIEGALLVTYTDPESFLKAVKPHLNPDQALALVCRSGNRSSRASRQIAGLVENPVIDVAGGMRRIVKEGYTPVPMSRGQRP